MNAASELLLYHVACKCVLSINDMIHLTELRNLLMVCIGYVFGSCMSTVQSLLHSHMHLKANSLVVLTEATYKGFHQLSGNPYQTLTYNSQQFAG